MAAHHFRRRGLRTDSGSFVGSISREEKWIEKFMRSSQAARGQGSSAFRNLPSYLFNASVAQLPERDASNVGDEGENPSGSAKGMWFNPNSRGSRLRIWQPWGCKSLHAHHFTAIGFSGNSRPRRLKIVEPSGCKSRVADRRVVHREQQTDSTQDRTALGVRVSPRRPNLECQPDERAGPVC